MKFEIKKADDQFKILRRRKFKLFWFWEIDTSRWVHDLIILTSSYNDPVTGNKMLCESDYKFKSEDEAEKFINKYGEYIETNGRLLREDKIRINSILELRNIKQ